MSMRTGMKRTILGACVIASAALAATQASAAVVFSDNFTTSNVNTAPGTPTATSTTYEIAATKNAPAATISGGHYKFGLASTSSAFVETQARFASTPVTLSSVGDFIDLNIGFTDTSGVLAASGASASLNVGLYNTGGVAPLTGLDQTGLSAGTTFNRGGAQLWQGYMGRVLQNASGAGVTTRNQQNAVTDSTGNDNNGNQDLVFNGAGTGTYKNPTGTTIGSNTTSVLGLTAGSSYTLDYKVTMTNPGELTFDYNILDSSSNNIFTATRVATGGNVITSSFDGLALGYRYAGASGDPASGLDLTSLSVSSNVTVPEPASLALLALGAVPLVRRKRA
jgi:hypothetical protein